MVDFVRLKYNSPDFAELLLKHPLLNFEKEEYRIRSGSTKIFTYQGLFFLIYSSKSVVIQGSLHKYWNKGKHNFNDYSYSDILLTLNDLTEKFTHVIRKGKIENIEIGVNINLPFAIGDYLNNVITLKGNSPSEKHPITNDLKGFGKGYHFKKAHYGLKIYDKGNQFDRQEMIVRHEFKTYKMQVIKEIALRTLTDLTDLNKIKLLSNYLLKTYEDTLFAEKLDKSDLSRDEERIYEECCNSQNWSNWNRDKRYNRLKKFRRIIIKNAQSDIKSIVISEIIRKFEILLNNNQ